MLWVRLCEEFAKRTMVRNILWALASYSRYSYGTKACRRNPISSQDSCQWSTRFTKEASILKRAGIRRRTWMLLLSFRGVLCRVSSYPLSIKSPKARTTGLVFFKKMPVSNLAALTAAGWDRIGSNPTGLELVSRRGQRRAGQTYHQLFRNHGGRK